jgi:hypothetical protein
MSTYSLAYRDVIRLWSNKNSKFLAAEKNGNATINRSQEHQWERFLILNPDNFTSTADIKTGDTVALSSFHNKYLVSESNGDVNANRDTIGPWERWKVYKFNNLNTGQTIFMSGNNHQGVISLQSSFNKFLLPDPTGEAKAVEQNIDPNPMPNNQTAIIVTRINWTDFYYDKPIGDTQCTSRGRYDSANCFVGKPPEGTPFIYQNNFYYTTNNQDPIMGWWDGAHAQVGNNNPYDIPFIYNGAYYLKPAGSIAANTVSISGPHGKFEATPQFQSLKVCIYPEEPQYNQLGQLIGTSPIPLNQIQFFKVCYKKKWSTYSICHQSITQSNPTTNCFDITGLQSGKDYKLKAFFGKKPYIQGNDIEVGVISSITVI